MNPKKSFNYLNNEFDDGCSDGAGDDHGEEEGEEWRWGIQPPAVILVIFFALFLSLFSSCRIIITFTISKLN